ncbi:TPA: hypothetical protein ACH3X3_15250 [Trebouxia sp. C0006]
MASAQAVREALWLKKLMGDFGIKVGAMPIYTDSQRALKLLKHPIASIRSKHVDVIHHFARERASRKEVCFAYCSTDEMVADCFTKPLPISKLGSVLQAWVLLKSLSLLQCCANGFRVEQFAPLILEQYKTM